MKTLYLSILIAGFYAGESSAKCYGNPLVVANPITIDLSDKLSVNSPEWTGQVHTQFSGVFDCTTRNNRLGYFSPIADTASNTLVVGFGDGKHWIKIQTSAPEQSEITLAERGQHSATELNIGYTVKATLVKKSGSTTTKNSYYIDNSMMASDWTGMSLWEIITWPIKQAGKFLSWLTGNGWPVDQRDMYMQPLTILYTPKATTCQFENAGLAVRLPRLGLAQLAGQTRPGFTPFTLNMRCENRLENGTSDRSIEMFLSSNNLLASDNSVMIDTGAGSAKGIGIRLTQPNGLSTPVIMSTSTTHKGNATSLFKANAGDTLDAQFTMTMGAYYFPYNLSAAGKGKINTSATLNIFYE
ncbi:fimbrial protein [Serratia proteamaculans]|uniref:fimbrial protein n=1 Tax=Serratia proteamaculans TaxID=28151 RepID=UPI000D8FAD46|nr:fimbrial protein [Serratia proteamaculans]CAI0973781.1 putative fimbrial-like adhesin protein StcD [Serratia proteamaculans]CAI1058850.1 putative fimbrial-like adhesin protein StcD [Serratia proteamaculans]CAI2474599.1 putative fimbrial-like adhesin protein StcD [Serratia proteamaculans]SPZ52633.1 putative fimbrial-like adhesin protein StcD [Serratia quinivorans]